MTFKNLTLAVMMMFATGSLVHANELEPAAQIKRDASIIKNVAALKERDTRDIRTDKSTLVRLIKTQKFDAVQTDDERRAIASLTGKTPKIARTNKFDTLLQNLFGG